MPTSPRLKIAHTVHTADGWQLVLYRDQPRTGHAAAPVLLLHGLASTPDCWYGGCAGGIGTSLAESGRDIWTLELRGGPHSQHATAPNEVRMSDKLKHDIPAAIAYILDQTGAQTLDAVGHSMGGGICACLAGTIPDKIKRLVLLEITGQGGMSPTRAPQQLGRSLHLLSVRHGLAKRSGAGGGRGGGAGKKDGKEAAGIWPQFQDAAAAAKQLSTASGKEQLQMYGLYKQAQAGPCDIPEPSDPKGKFKYKAWKAHGEMPREEAAAKVRALPSRCERAFASVR